MVVWELLLAHLLGDFVFQSNDLIHRKYKSWTGVMEHVFIITFFTILFLFPYWNAVVMWESTAAIFLIHFIQDLLKIKYDIRFNSQKKSTLPYFMDQAFHIGLIVFLAQKFATLPTLPLPSMVLALYSSQILTVYCIGLVLVSYTYDITLYQFKRQKDKKNKEFVPDFKNMQKRVFIFSLAFGLFLMVYGRLV